MILNEFKHKIFQIKCPEDFDELALSLFEFQYTNNPVYKSFCDLIKRPPSTVSNVNEIPCMPISFFKSQEVKTGKFKEEVIFTSSGTTGHNTSKHFVRDVGLYQQSFEKSFSLVYPNWKDSVIIGLLPSYLEREGSSLIFMVEQLIKNSKHKESRFQLNADDELINFLQTDSRPKLLFGVTFALLELANKNLQLKNTIIIETGGMKGRGKELTRDELHKQLMEGLNPIKIDSEYGMTELLSQAYLINGVFHCPPWMKVLVRETTDPLNVQTNGKGAINVIDLANIFSCSFIATDDLAELNEDGTFKVMGRIDHSQVRGCNLLVV